MAKEGVVVMWHIGALLDAWDGLANDTRQTIEQESPALMKAIRRIRAAATPDDSDEVCRECGRPESEHAYMEANNTHAYIPGAADSAKTAAGETD